MISNITSDFMSQRTYGGVGGTLSDGRPYPYRGSFKLSFRYEYVVERHQT